MANKIQLKRGLKSKIPTLSQGEPAYTTDTRELYIGTGSGNVCMSGGIWITGTGMSDTSTSTTYYYSGCPQVKVGDMFLNTTYGYIYQCTTAGSGTTARWTYKGSIKGTAGEAGEDGKNADVGDVIEIMSKISNVTLNMIYAIDDLYYQPGGNSYLMMPPLNTTLGKTYFITSHPSEDYDHAQLGEGDFAYFYDTDGNNIWVYREECALLRVDSSSRITVLKKW